MTKTQEEKLYQLFAQATDKKDIKKMLSLLTSPSERSAMAHRLEILKRLAAGQPQRKIAADLGVSIATVSRGAKEFQEKKKLVEWMLDTNA